MNRVGVIAALVGLVAGSHAPFALAQSSVFPSKNVQRARRLLDPAHVSSSTKSLMRTRMKSHGQDMKDMVMAVALLQYQDVRRHAETIANAPRLDKSAGEATDLGDGFFTLQDEVRARAAELGKMADHKDPKATAQALGHLVDTCVTCHAIYLGPKPGEPAKVEAAATPKK